MRQHNQPVNSGHMSCASAVKSNCLNRNLTKLWKISTGCLIQLQF